MYEKVCIVCGKVFTSKGTRAYYCIDCKEEAYQKVAERKQYRFLEARRNRATQARIRKNASKAPKLHEINEQAKESGLSYGEYQAMLYQERMKNWSPKIRR